MSATEAKNIVRQFLGAIAAGDGATAAIAAFHYITGRQWPGG